MGFLGHIISARGVGVDPAKVEDIRNWARLSTCSDVCRFVGLAHYYRRFVPRFSDIAAQLTALSNPRASFRNGCRRAAEFRRSALTSAPVLRVCDPARPTRLVTDASELKFKVQSRPGRSNPADFLSRMNFPSGTGPAPATGYEEPDSMQELFTASSPEPSACAFTQVAEDGPRFLATDFSAAVGQAILEDPGLANLALAADAGPPGPASDRRWTSQVP